VWSLVGFPDLKVTELQTTIRTAQRLPAGFLGQINPSCVSIEGLRSTLVAACRSLATFRDIKAGL
jgi:hypothetical protein